MDRDQNTIKHLRGVVEKWRELAEGEILSAQQFKKEAEDFSERLEHTLGNTTNLTCLLCNGEMSDLTPLEQLADELWRRSLTLLSEDLKGKRSDPDPLSPWCRVCGTYQTDRPRDSASRWLPEDLEAGSKVFAAEVFDALHRVDEVALEQRTGRGWMFRVGDEWYANGATKERFRELVGI